MKRAKLNKIEVRAAEIADFEALVRRHADRNTHSQTLQLPFPSPALCRKRLSQQDEAHHALVATVAGEVVGNRLTRLTRVRRALQARIVSGPVVANKTGNRRPGILREV